MKYLSSLLSAASGSVGGTVYSHNKGGQYCRNRNIPPDKHSPAQLDWRAHIGMMANLWITLSDADRASWATYAQQVPRRDRLGQMHYLSAQQHWLRSNLSRVKLLGTGGMIAAAPAIYNTGTPCSISYPAAWYYDVGTVLMQYTVGNDVLPPDYNGNSIVMHYASAPESPTHTYRRNPLILLGYDMVEDAWPAGRVQQYTANLGYSPDPAATWLATIVSYSDGRLSETCAMRVITQPSVPASLLKVRTIKIDSNHTQQ